MSSYTTSEKHDDAHLNARQNAPSKQGGRRHRKGIYARRLSNYANRGSLAYKLRKRRAQHISQLIEACYAEHGQCSIIDCGGTERYWTVLFGDDYLASRGVTVTLVNHEKKPGSGDASPIYRQLIADACDLHQFKAQSFDIAHSNSVIEHLGQWERMVAFASEVSRVGKRYFVQTPNFWFPLEPHFGLPFFHWLPRPMRIAILHRYNVGHHTKSGDMAAAVRTDQNCQLVNRAVFRYLFEDAEIIKEKLLFMTKSLIAVRREPRLLPKSDHP